MSKEEIVEMLRERVEKGEKMWKNAEALGKKFDTAPGTII